MQDKLLEQALQTHFKYSQFRTGQKEIIQDILKGKDVLGILPTGSGKSLCYQLPAQILNGTTVVVSPLISLMIDQEKQLKANHFKSVVAITSFMDRIERHKVYKQLASYKLIYVSPELLQQEQLQKRLQHIHINLFVIDEAHCISQWGHEFRPDYLKLHSIIQSLGNPPILALSATATEEVQADIINSLKRDNMIKHIYPMDRDNICFNIYKVEDDNNKLDQLIHILSLHRVPTLIYFSSRKSTETYSSILAKKLPDRSIAFYHGGMDQMDRLTIQQQFMNNQLDVICCTSAFGMGINKDNIRLVIHFHFPTQLESFIQEVGRAGRDGESSVSILFYSKKDEYLPSFMIEKELPSEEELIFVFNQLSKLAKENKSLPKTDDDIELVFQINEIKWRFIQYQIEKNGIIKNNQIIYHQQHWQKTFHIINQYRKQRLTTKYTSLNNMKAWLNEDGCLREHLYKHFQPSYQRPKQYCCSNCGFSILDWKTKTHSNKNNPPNFKSWESKLQSLLLIGEKNESK